MCITCGLAAVFLVACGDFIGDSPKKTKTKNIMKTLVLRLHSITDGPNNAIGPEGLELAKRQGQLTSDRGIDFNQLFYAPYVATAQTALAFCEGLNYVPATTPVVSDLDYGALLAEISTDQFASTVKSGLSNFMAILQVHGEAKAKQWAELAHRDVLWMFDQMEYGEDAIGFFHSPTIELAAWSCGVKVGLPD